MSDRLVLCACAITLFGCGSKDKSEPPDKAVKPSSTKTADPALGPDAALERVLAFNAHVTIMRDVSSPITGDLEDVAAKIAQSHPKSSLQRFDFVELTFGDSKRITVKGVEPDRFAQVMPLEPYLKEGSLSLEWNRETESLPPALIGTSMAKTQKLKLGSTFELKPLDDLPELATKAQSFRVVGVLQSGFDAYEEAMVVTHIDAVSEIAKRPGSVLGVELTVADKAKARSVARAIEHELGGAYMVLDWCELNQQLFVDICSPLPPAPGTRAENTTACDGNDGAACERAGRMWLQGHDGPQSRDKANEFFDRSCALEHPEGCYRFAVGLTGYAEIDFDKATPALEFACNSNVARACSELGAYLDTQTANKDRAAALMKKACDGGDTRGCAYLGARYMSEGRSAAAKVVFEKGCNTGDGYSCSELSVIDSGRADELRKKAREYDRQNCDKGHPDACARLRR